jgi:hypothetical protein
MTLDEMATESAVCRKSAFEVNWTAGADGSQIGSCNGFPEQVEGDLSVPSFRGGETTAINGHAVARVEVRCDEGRANA